jgi:paraquat-inducible protein A
MSKRNILALILTLVSLALLWPGLTKPALTIKATMTFLGQTRELTNETRSVVSAAKKLYQDGNKFVAALILLFSILIPFIKAALIIPVFAMRESPAAERIYRFVRAISKWAMADVFAVGMLIAFLVAKGTANLSAIAGPGFYYFASYCLVSNLAFQLLESPGETARAHSALRHSGSHPGGTAMT